MISAMQPLLQQTVPNTKNTLYLNCDVTIGASPNDYRTKLAEMLGID